MKSIIRLKSLAFAAMLAGFGGAVVADAGTTTSTVDGVTVVTAVDPYSEALASIAADRYGTIAGIVAIWKPRIGGNDDWEAEFTAGLEKADNQQLYDIQNADSYDAVIAILQGREAPVSMEGVSSPEVLGDRSRDLVFTPVVPCRFFDTRFGFGPHTSGTIATTRQYFVWGTAAQLVPQGHNNGNPVGARGCPSPNGEPVGIHANFTAVPFASPTTGRGNIRAWPIGGTLPGVSLVNYEAGTNIANAASVATRFFSSTAQDINVTTQFHSADSVGDVMGYYYPATFPTRTLFFSIPAEAFVSARGNPVQTSWGNGGAYATTTTVSDAMVAPVHLPDGARITNFTIWVEDNAPGDLLIHLERRLHASNGFFPIATLNSSGAAPGITQLASGPLGHVVNNTTENYFVRAYSTTWPGNSTLRVNGARIRYTYTY